VVRQLLRALRLPLQIGFVLLLLAFLGRAAYLRWDDVRQIQVSAHPAWITLGTLLTIIFTLGLSLNWQWLVRRLSPHETDLSSLGLHHTFLTSFVTRYLPAGTFVNIGGKVELLRRQGGSRSLAWESVVYEIVFLMGGGLFLAWVAFLAEPAPWLLGQWESLYPVMMAGLTVAWILCFAAPDRVLLWSWSVLRRKAPAAPSARLRVFDRLTAFVLYTLVNLVQGLAVLFMLFAVYPDMPRQVPVMLHVIAAYPIGRLVGQAAPFAPGGIGVREATFVFLATPWLPLKPVLIAATLMRLISILVEILSASVVVGLARWDSRRVPQGE
ncbi:MAG: lysylphosphatidylglycerol synthase domain-containing protein, partial [Anaerolineales bacterium]|nr:lysylphosphatidylglycerol synthase domain-containing protein [Anaerolineales bacterium]